MDSEQTIPRVNRAPWWKIIDRRSPNVRSWEPLLNDIIDEKNMIDLEGAGLVIPGAILRPTLDT
jgi:hypothetical protein